MAGLWDELHGNGADYEPPKPKPIGANMTDEQREKIRQRNLSIASAVRAGGRSQAAIAKAFGVSTSTVQAVAARDRGGPVKKKELNAIEQAEAKLRQAQSAVLIAEAELLDAQAKRLRDRATAFQEGKK